MSMKPHCGAPYFMTFIYNFTCYIYAFLSNAFQISDNSDALKCFDQYLNVVKDISSRGKLLRTDQGRE